MHWPDPCALLHAPCTLCQVVLECDTERSELLAEEAQLMEALGLVRGACSRRRTVHHSAAGCCWVAMCALVGLTRVCCIMRAWHAS